ncbi:TolC family protein [Oligoflexus tunisiensis]|uniref:TolC family protein n=1 Tax=Oligoflexus tunisiensis TaxID=708132 RepID=UPI00159F043E|nr:TolC family protein [Oligoflexus tunisiensis]
MDRHFISFFLLLFMGSAAAETLSLDDLPRLIEQRNSSVQRAAADASVAESDQAVARADFLPSLTLKATQTRTDEAITLDVPPQSIQRTLPNGAPFRLDIDPPPLILQDRDVSKAQLQLIQPLYMGGRLGAQQEARDAELSIKTAEYTQEKSQQLSVVLQRYFQAQYTREVLNVLARFKKHLTRIDQLTKGLIASGAIPRVMRRRTETALAELQAMQVRAAAQEKVLCQAVQSLIQAQGTCQFKSALKRLPMPSHPRALQTIAHTQRPEWKILEHQAAKADALHDAATGTLLPNVYAFGRYELLQEQLTLLEPKWVIGLGLEWTLTAGLKSIPEREKAEALRRKVAIGRAQAQRDIPLQIEQYWAQAAGELAALQATDKALEAAQETLEISELRYGTGDGSQLDVLNAYSDVEKLSIKRLELLESYNRYLISLFAATGDTALYIQHYHKSM